jgi:hypothetical protein
MIPIFRSFSVQTVKVKGCFEWYYITETPEKYTCTCGKDCQPKEGVPGELQCKAVTLKNKLNFQPGEQNNN